MAKPLTIDTLKREAGVSDTLLNHAVEERHLLTLAGLFGSSEQYVGIPGLELDESQKADVRNITFKDGNKMGMLKALTIWWKRNPYITYRSLIEMMLELHEGVLADKVCKQLHISLPEAPNLDPHEPGVSGCSHVPPLGLGEAGIESPKVNIGHLTLKACSEKVIARLSSEPKTMADALHGKGFISTETLREISQVPATDNARKLYLSVLECVEHHPHRYSEFISVLSENTRLYDDLLKVLEETYQEKATESRAVLPTLDLDQNNSHSTFLSSQPNSPVMSLKWFDEWFRKLRKSALAELSDKGVTVQDFRRTLMTLPNAITKEHEQFLLSKYPLFEEAKSIESIFLHLNFYLSFIDFSLLEHIIKHFGSHELKQRMKTYADDMRSFRMETIVSDVIPLLPQKSKSPQHHTMLELKVDFDIATCSLEDVDQYRKRFACEFLLSDFIFLLAAIKKGSVLLVMLIPSAIIPYLKDHVKSNGVSFFLKLQILKMSANKECIYPFPAIKHVSTALAKALPVTSVGSSGGSQPQLSLQGQTTSTEKMRKPVLDITPSRQRKADQLTSTIESTPNARGLAIITLARPHSYHHIYNELLHDMFRHLKFAVFEDKEDIADIMYAAGHLVSYPKSSNFTIVVCVTGRAKKDVNMLSTRYGEVNISRDIIEPLLPPSAPDLAYIPKVFLINSLSEYHHRPLDTSTLSVPSEGNFIISYISIDDGDDYIDVADVLEHELTTSRDSVEYVLTKVKHQLHPRFSMTVISHLDRPVYLHPDGPQKHSHTGDLSSDVVKTRTPPPTTGVDVVKTRTPPPTTGVDVVKTRTPPPTTGVDVVKTRTPPPTTGVDVVKTRTPPPTTGDDVVKTWPTTEESSSDTTETM